LFTGLGIGGEKYEAYATHGIAIRTGTDPEAAPAQVMGYSRVYASEVEHQMGQTVLGPSAWENARNADLVSVAGAWESA
jgi:hypothetical protein